MNNKYTKEEQDFLDVCIGDDLINLSPESFEKVFAHVKASVGIKKSISHNKWLNVKTFAPFLLISLFFGGVLLHTARAQSLNGISLSVSASVDKQQIAEESLFNSNDLDSILLTDYGLVE